MMKKAFTLFVFVFFAGSLLFTRQVSAQAPEKMSYQAVIRNSNGELVRDQEVGLRVSILQNSIDGTVVYQEIYNPHPKTNNNGLLTIEIGAVVPLTGIFSEIDWSDSPYFLKTETDPSGGTIYTITGISQLLSVPYALHSKSSNILTGEITESQIIDLQDYLTDESDPLFALSPAAGIDDEHLTAWNAAYGWGDHAEQGYLTEEQDPVFTAWDKSSGITITEIQISDLKDYATKDMQNQTITNLAEPTDKQDAATKGYVDLLKRQLELMNEINLEAGSFGTVADVDGNIYKTIKIGDQIWMAENLSVTRYNDGTPIPLREDLWSGSSAYCWYENDYDTYGAIYGALYNWNAVDTVRNGGKNICPIGWHIPTGAEWSELLYFLDANGFSYDGSISGTFESNIKIAKSLAATTNWESSSNEGTVGNTDYPEKRNITGFTALPGGRRDRDGAFHLIGKQSNWWSSRGIEYRGNITSAVSRLMTFQNPGVYSTADDTQTGYSVRCLKE